MTSTGIPVADALLVIAAATGLALAVRRHLVRWTRVTSGSMLPTLRPGDRRLTLRAPRVGRLSRGDVVVVRSDELGLDVVKRVIGLPGDRVRIQLGGAVHVNGTPLREPYVAFPGGPGGHFHVPPRMVLVLGDNRAASSDSRHWRDPYLPERALRGRLLRPSRPVPLVTAPPGWDPAPAALVRAYSGNPAALARRQSGRRSDTSRP